jgi:hypothetical protein
MPFEEKNGFRILLYDESQRGSNKFYCPFCSNILTRSGQNPLTEEDICPVALGNKKWKLGLCKNCNNGFSNRFEQKFLEQPWTLYGRQLHSISGRRGKSQKAIIEGLSKNDNNSKLHRVKLDQGDYIESVHPLPLERFQTPKDLPENWRNDNTLIKYQIPIFTPVLLEATKIMFEQLHWHLDLQLYDLPVISLIKSLLSKVDVESLSAINPYVLNNDIGYLLSLNFIEPIARNDGEGRVQFKFPDGKQRYSETYSDQLIQGWIRHQQIRSDKTHRFYLKVQPPSDYGPRRLEFTFDLAYTIKGLLWFTLKDNDLKILTSRFECEDWVNWNSGEHDHIFLKV